jgi:hypothetical protein
MTQFKSRKSAIRARMALTGESFTQASRYLGEQHPELAETTLFRDEPRTDRTAKRFNEPAYAFLNRSADPRIAEIRALMTSWLSNVPAKDQPDVRRQLKSKKDAQFESAFWELYLHEAYYRSGYSVTIHPPLNGTGRHPDFLVEGHGSRFYLEAVRACASGDEISQNKMLEDVRQLLDPLTAWRFRLDMTTLGLGKKPPNVTHLKRALREWLSGVDTADEDEHKAAAARYRPVSHLTWRRDGWHFQFAAVPIDLERVRDGQRLVGTHTSGGWSRDTERIISALSTKADGYGPLDAPLVIAVLSNSEFGTEDYEFETALYGALIGRRPAAEAAPPDALHVPGHWYCETGWRHANSPQVIAALGLFPWTVAKVRPRLWNTLEPGILPPTQPAWLTPVHVTGPAPQLGPADSMSSLFGLPEPWPTVPPELLPNTATAIL